MNITVLIPAYKPPASFLALMDGLKQAGFSDIIVIDDGSGHEYAEIFQQVAVKGGKVLHHSSNEGKGQALKTGFRYCLKRPLPAKFIITADCDGQHKIDDIEKLFYTLEENPTGIVLGVRCFDGETPLRSRFGNRAASFLAHRLHHLALEDTQTGLRGFSAAWLPGFSTVAGKRYEYETNMLIYAENHGAPFLTVPIETVYLEGNCHSHYRAVRDSLRVTMAMFTSIGRK